MRADPHDFADAQPLTQITFAERMRCGMAGCDHMTTDGLIECDLETTGLWRLLPICPQCLSALHSVERSPRATKRASHDVATRKDVRPS